MFKRENHERVVYFGPHTLGAVRLSDVNELQQVRTSYDAEGLAELATSMVIDADAAQDPATISSNAFNLSNPIIVARFTVGHDDVMRRFVLDHAEHYGNEEVDFPDYAEDGSTVILIGGHRRKRSLYQLADRFAIDPDNIEVAANIHENISFADALRLQLSENVHERPPVQDEARAIERFYYDVVRQNGTPPSIKQFSMQLGFSETKVRDALAFASLPRELQDLTDQGLLSYSTVKKFKPLQDVHEKYYDATHTGGRDGRDAYVRDSLMIDASRLIKSRLDGSETRAAEYIHNLVVSDESQLNATEPLFEWAQDTPGQRRSRVARELSRTADRTLEWQMNTGDLDVDAAREMSAKLAAYVERAKSHAQPVSPIEFDWS